VVSCRSSLWWSCSSALLKGHPSRDAAPLERHMLLCGSAASLNAAEGTLSLT